MQSLPIRIGLLVPSLDPVVEVMGTLAERGRRPTTERSTVM